METGQFINEFPTCENCGMTKLSLQSDEFGMVYCSPACKVQLVETKLDSLSWPYLLIENQLHQLIQIKISCPQTAELVSRRYWLNIVQALMITPKIVELI